LLVSGVVLNSNDLYLHQRRKEEKKKKETFVPEPQFHHSAALYDKYPMRESG